MNLNGVQLSGRMANFGENYREKTEEKSAFAVRFVNIQLDRKDSEGKYYESRAIKVIANGYNAEKLHNFAPQEEIVFTGILTTDNDWTTDDGELKKGDWLIKINNIANWPEAMSNKTTDEKTTATVSSKPSLPGKKGPKLPPAKKAPKANKKTA